MPQHNARFAVTPAEVGSAFVPVAQAQWRDILCIQDPVSWRPDNTVSWNGRKLQIPPHPARAHFVRATVRVHAYPDGGTAIFHGPRCLVHWQPCLGEQLERVDRSEETAQGSARSGPAAPDRDEPNAVRRC